jgi:hypothetical protein
MIRGICKFILFYYKSKDLGYKSSCRPGFGRIYVRISTETQAILSEVLRGSPQFVMGNVGMVLKIRTHFHYFPYFYTFIIHYSLKRLSY